MKNIEWCDMTWNPVWGCRNNCEYCYARRIAKRFWRQIALANKFFGVSRDDPGFRRANRETRKSLKNFEPVWLYRNFEKEFPKKPSRIFVNSMSDINFWRPEWMAAVIRRIKEHTEHTFLFLTKFPGILSFYDFPENCWLGVSCPGTPTEEMIRWAMLCKNRHFVSIEPLMEEPYLDWLEFMNWVIVGGLTPKPVHKSDWVERIVYQCINDHVPVFVKNNAYFRRANYQQFPASMEGWRVIEHQLGKPCFADIKHCGGS